MSILNRSMIPMLLLVAFSLGCSAQSSAPKAANSPSAVDQRIEKQIRILFEGRISPDVNITVGNRRPSEFPDYDTVTVTLSMGDKKQTQDFLVSKDGKTLARFSKWDISKDPYAEVADKIDITGRPMKGNKDAKVTIVNYDDFQCPFCSHMHQTMNQIMKVYGDRVRLVYKDFPLIEIHPWAMRAALDANCLAAQSTPAYWSFADYVHSHGSEISGPQRDAKIAEQNVNRVAREQAAQFKLDTGKLDACIAKPNTETVAASMKEGMGLGVDATPTLFVNGEKISGALPMEGVEAVINRALRDAGEPIPAAAKAEATKPDTTELGK